MVCGSHRYIVTGIAARSDYAGGSSFSNDYPTELIKDFYRKNNNENTVLNTQQKYVKNPNTSTDELYKQQISVPVGMVDSAMNEPNVVLPSITNNENVQPNYLEIPSYFPTTTKQEQQPTRQSKEKLAKLIQHELAKLDLGHGQVLHN